MRFSRHPVRPWPLANAFRTRREDAGILGATGRSSRSAGAHRSRRMLHKSNRPARLCCCVFVIVAGLATHSWSASTSASLANRFAIGEEIHRDDFDHGLDNWSAELQSGGTVTAKESRLEIDVPAGCTVWFKPLLAGPVLIEYDATVIGAGGPNDRASDLNCFWMARDSRSPDDIFNQKRSGKFADYNQLLTYYVGQGGNGNTT